MKKIIFSLIFILGILSLSVFAEVEEVRFSEDFSKLYIGNESFSVYNTSLIKSAHLEKSIEIEPSDTQNSISVNIDTNMYVASVYVVYNSGARLSFTYMNDSIIDEYESFMASVSDYTVDFVWPDDNIVTADKDLFYGEEIIMDFKASGYRRNDVTVTNEKLGLTIAVGIVAKGNGGKYYFADYAENGVTDPSAFRYTENRDAVLHLITDEEFILKLDEAQEEYYGDADSVNNGNIFMSLSVGFVIVLFCVIPAALLLVCLFAAIRCKGIYKKLYFAVCFFCAAELSVFITLLILTARYN